MRAHPRHLALVLALAAAACSKTDDSASQEPSPGSREEPVERAPAEAEAPERYDEPVERRLHSDRLEASSYLWNSWNRFRENYHPNYVMDGDPDTAWVEGADGPGEGEWIRAHLSVVGGATELRIRLRNGYHKSASLYEKNGRVRDLDIVVLPSGTSSRHRLDDDMKWQQVRVPLEGERVTGVELRAVSVYEGSRYEDLVVSDLEVFATGLTVENPAFEAQKLERIEAWKRERRAAAALADGESLPIARRYAVETQPERADAPQTSEGPHAELRRALAIAAARHAPHRDALAALDDRLGERFAGYLPVRLVAKGASPIPAVPGLAAPTGPELLWGRTDAFLLPATDSFALVDGAAFGAFDVRDERAPAAALEGCREPATSAFRPPGASEGPHLEELVVIRCIAEETREGLHHRAVVQALRFDGEGRLALAAGPHTVAVYAWDGRTLAGGTRYWGDGRMDTLSRLDAGEP